MATKAALEVHFKETKALFELSDSIVIVGEMVGVSLDKLHVTPVTVSNMTACTQHRIVRILVSLSSCHQHAG
ncbi:hypothetical protein DAPPUDRAFT_251067 [Daphnia pulex]|uniref:Uncharacterized protein n=1 Tax=Daphnia pulex TaxID=6669 RepID=E9GZP5_DAPPU|nr:hypothetical protein DAPPUDRAFT_251067 [Daphnia pulex]|eukprot:EFX75028.1 hypothetical protein DAPPUDRAFT_251067 [Daphnia pulex]